MALKARLKTFAISLGANEMNTNTLLARFDNNEVLISDNQEAVLAANLNHAFEVMERISAAEQAAIKMRDSFWPDPDSWLATYRPYNVSEGILTIPVKGILLNDYPWQDGAWATGYTYIQKALERGLSDPAVKGIMFAIDSGGGEVSGNFDLVDMIYEARGQKPMRAVAAEFAYSAAYSIASAADEITVGRTGGVGSIGVVTSRVDYSKALEKAGIKVHLIHYGKNKVDSYSTEPLSDDAKSRIQARVDELGEIFVATVARNRSIEAQIIRDTEASTFTATQALSNGLADKIGSLDDSVAAFAAELSNRKKGTIIMSGQTQPETAFDQAAVDAARAEGRAEGERAAVERIKGILASEEGTKRPKAALSAALKTSMTVQEATAFLSDIAEEKAEVVQTEQQNATGKNFKEAMDEGKQADLGTPGDSESAGQVSRAQRTLAMTKGTTKAA